MAALTKTVKRLSEISIKDYINPYSHLSWPESLDESQWYTSPELISLYGTRRFEALSEHERKRLSFYEAVNFFSLNIHGEKSLIEGLAARLYKKGNDEISPYLHHFLDEENKHSSPGVSIQHTPTPPASSCACESQRNNPAEMKRGDDESERRAYLASLSHISGFPKQPKRISVHSRSLGGDTPLHIAVRERNLTAVHLLLTGGADVDAVGEDGCLPIHWAVETNQPQIVRELINAGASIYLKEGLADC